MNMPQRWRTSRSPRLPVITPYKLDSVSVTRAHADTHTHTNTRTDGQTWLRTFPLPLTREVTNKNQHHPNMIKSKSWLFNPPSLLCNEFPNVELLMLSLMEVLCCNFILQRIYLWDLFIYLLQCYCHSFFLAKAWDLRQCFICFICCRRNT